MKKSMPTTLAILFFLVLATPSFALALDKENPKGDHRSSDQHDEGSGMKMNEKNHTSCQKNGEYKKNGKHSEHSDEGSGMR